MSTTTTTPTPVPPPVSNATVLGAPIVSVLAYLVFLAAMGIAYAIKNTELLVTLCGMAGANATTVVSFWLGSSKGSQDKDTTIAAQSSQLAAAAPVPAPSATTGPVVPPAPVVSAGTAG